MDAGSNAERTGNASAPRVKCILDAPSSERGGETVDSHNPGRLIIMGILHGKDEENEGGRSTGVSQNRKESPFYLGREGIVIPGCRS